MKLGDLIRVFAEKVGIENVPATEGMWKFSADGNVFGVTGDETGEKVWIYGDIASPDPGRRAALLKAAMEANYFHRGTGGATFSLNPDTGALTLFDSRRLDALDEKEFFSFVEAFVNSLATWNAIGESGARAAEEETADPKPGAFPDAMLV